MCLPSCRQARGNRSVFRFLPFFSLRHGYYFSFNFFNERPGGSALGSGNSRLICEFHRSFAESIERLRDLYRGKLKLLYMAPEKLEPSYFTDCLSQVPLSMVVIDEAHCVSQWGHDFRPSYGKIKTFVDSLPEKPV